MSGTKIRFDLVLIIVVYLIFTAFIANFAKELIPDKFHFIIINHDIEINRIHERLIDDFVIIVAVLPLSFILELIVLGWDKSSLKEVLFNPTESVKTDIAYLVFDQLHIFSLLSRVLLFGASMISWMWLRELIAAKTGMAIDPGGIPFVAQVVLFFIALSFFDYWTHRAAHSKLLWPIHRYHHAARDFCILTGWRQHPADFVPIFLMNLPMALLGAQPEVMIYVAVLKQLSGLLIHSKIESDWGWVGKYVLQSPVHHRMHHKLDMTQPTIHFSSVPVWDRLFGTWDDHYNPGEPIGVDTEYRHGFWVFPDMFRDYLDLWRGFIALIWKPFSKPA